MDDRERARVEAVFDQAEPSTELVDEVIGLVGERGGLVEAREEARGAAAKARERLAGLPEGDCLQALHTAVDYVVDRVR